MMKARIDASGNLFVDKGNGFMPQVCARIFTCNAVWRAPTLESLVRVSSMTDLFQQLYMELQKALSPIPMNMMTGLCVIQSVNRLS